MNKDEHGHFGKGNVYSTKEHKEKVRKERIYNEVKEKKILDQIRENLADQPEEVRERVASEYGMKPHKKLLKRIEEITNRIIDESAYLHDIDWDVRNDRTIRKDLLSSLSGLQSLLIRLVRMAESDEDKMSNRDKSKLSKAKVALLDDAKKKLANRS